MTILRLAQFCLLKSTLWSLQSLRPSQNSTVSSKRSESRKIDDCNKRQEEASLVALTEKSKLFVQTLVKADLERERDEDQGLKEKGDKQQRSLGCMSGQVRLTSDLR